MKKIIVTLIAVLSLASLKVYGIDLGNDDGNVRISLPILVNYSQYKTIKRSNGINVADESENYSNEYASVTIYKPYVTISGDKNSEKVINSQINNIVDNFKNRIEEDSRRDNKYNIANGLPITQYIVNINNTIHYKKDNILSLTLHLYSYTGGAHGSSTDISLNLDTNTGNNGALKDFLGNNPGYDDIILKSIKNEVAKNPDMYFKESIDKLSKLPYNQKFYLEDGYVVVYFDEYEIAPYVAGSPKFTIPLSLFPNGLNKVEIKEETPTLGRKYIEGIERGMNNNECISLPYINSYSSPYKYKDINEAITEEIFKTVGELEKNIKVKGVTAYFDVFFQNEKTIQIFMTYVGNDENDESIVNISKEYIVNIDNSQIVEQ